MIKIIYNEIEKPTLKKRIAFGRIYQDFHLCSFTMIFKIYQFFVLSLLRFICTQTVLTLLKKYTNIILDECEGICLKIK